MNPPPDALRRYHAARSLDQQPFQSACYAPFVSLYFHTNGDVVACCKSTHHRLGNVTRQSLAEIWHGERATAMRAALRNDEFGDACRFCAWQIGAGHEHVHAKIYDPLPATADGDPWPARMDFTLSNTCNLACVMCYGVLSSTIRAHRDRLPPLPRVYGEGFFADLRPFLTRLRHATFMGGEPFLAQENHRVWELLIEDRLQPHCHVITNGTQWNPRIERVLEALPMDISVSIDGVTPATVESIRVNARLATVMENAARFLAYTRRRGTRMSLMFCLMRQNWREFGAYLRLAEGWDVDVDLNVVVDPPPCSLHTLPPPELAAVVDELEREGVREGHGELRRNGRLWRRTLTDLRHEAEAAAKRPASVASGPSQPVADPIGDAWRDLQRGDHTAARRRLAAIDPLDLGDRHYDLLVCRAHAERVAGEFAVAGATLAAAIELWDRSPHAFLERGWLHLTERRGEAALADALAAKERLANTQDRGAPTQVQRILASALGLLGRTDEAIAALRAIPLDEPAAYDVATNEAWLCRVAGRLDEAQAAIDRARGLQPQRVAAWLEQAWLDQARGRPREALRAADEALARVAKESEAAEAPGVQVARAVSLRALGDLSGAKAALQVIQCWRPEDAFAAGQLQEIAALEKERATRAPLCVAAESALLIDADKTVRPCCDYWGKHRDDGPGVGRLGEQALVDILAGPVWNSLRADLAAHRAPAGCAGCLKREATTGSSHRLLLERLHAGARRPGISYLELNSSNLCNLQCRHCNPRYSSRWAAHERRHGRPTSPVTQPDPQLLLDNLRGVDLQHLAFVSLKGGEPMLNADVPTLLQHLDERGVLGKVTVFVVTNGTTLDQQVLALLARAKKVALCVSVDGHGDLQTYIRHGASDLATIEHNLCVYAALPNFVLDRNTAVMAYNVFHLDRIDAWWGELAKRFPGRCRPSHYESFVLWPEDLSVHCLQDATRAELAAKYTALDPVLYAPVIAVLRQPFAGPTLHDALVRRTRREDAELGRSILDVVPELAAEMVLLGGDQAR